MVVPDEAKQVPNPDHYAIVIGIDGYVQLRPLHAAGKDAVLFMEWLIKPDGGGLPIANVALIQSRPELPQNPFEAQPTKIEIDNAITRLGIRTAIKEGRRRGKRLYFYFAGHGFGSSFDEVGMLMADAALDRLVSNIGLRNFRHYFRAAAAFNEVIFILDCCRDPMGNIQTFGPGFDLPEGVRAAADAVQDFVVLAAVYGAKAFEARKGITSERRGLLTSVLLEALEVPEATDALGRFTAATVRDYLRTRLPELARQTTTRKQDPSFDPDPLGEIVFATIPEDRLPRVRVRIVAPPGLGGDLVLTDRGKTEVERRRAADAVQGRPAWEVSLVRNRYYMLASSLSRLEVLPNIIDLTDVQDNLYIYEFKPGKSAKR